MATTLTIPLEITYELITTENALGYSRTIVRLMKVGKKDWGGESYLCRAGSFNDNGGINYCIGTKDGSREFMTPKDAFQAITDFGRQVQKERLAEEITVYQNKGLAIVACDAKSVLHPVNPLTDGDWKRPQV